MILRLEAWLTVTTAIDLDCAVVREAVGGVIRRLWTEAPTLAS